MKRVILPPSTIGIIGGGQLGKMMAVEAKKMGYGVVVLDPTKSCPAAGVSDRQIVASFNDPDAIKELCTMCDVVAYEFENIDVDIINKLSNDYYIPSGGDALYISQHRMREKEFAKQCGVNVLPFAGVKDNETLINAIKIIGYPSVLKTCRFGYDGKGQKVLKSEKDLTEVSGIINSKDAILETFVDFDYEISVIVTRGYDEIVTFPIPINQHINNILDKSIVGKNKSDEIKDKAVKFALDIVSKLNYIGTMAIELFVKGEEVYFNEMAPRPHNSGHYSIEGCNQSQFETHIKAICGLNLGEVKLLHPTIMVNILGQDLDNVRKFIQSKDFNQSALHLYGKDEVKVNRKMGHITFYGDDIKELEKKVTCYSGGKNE